VDGYTVGAAAKATGWSARMLRYLEHAQLVVPRRSASGYRLYGVRELNQLRTLQLLRARFRVELSDLAFAVRLRREPALRAAVEGWLARADADPADWVDWEQRKQERLLAA
jgi:MerR family transcriptional regulator, copper efflux regulator